MTVRRLLCGLLAAAGLTLSACGGSHPIVPSPSIAEPGNDPLAYSSGRESDYVRRAAAGLSHLIYEKSPGGIVASVARTEHWQPQIAGAAASAGVDADTLAGVVLLESAGRADALAGNDVRSAAGLTQIVASTGTSLLGMPIDLTVSRRLTRKIAAALKRKDRKRAARLAAARRRADPRFDPARALAATALYLRLARARLGREDLAVESYHMGIGNLQTALSRFGAGRVSYARLFFDSSPLTHVSAWSWLSALGDDSATYLWRVYAARDIIRLARSNPAALARDEQLQLSDPSGSAFLHPPGERLAAALVAPPAKPLAADGISLAAGGARLRVPAATLLGYLGARVRLISRTRPLSVSAVTPDGWTLDIARSYRTPAQAQAFQFELDRLTALDLIGWARAGAVIQLTVAGNARRVLD